MATGVALLVGLGVLTAPTAAGEAAADSGEPGRGGAASVMQPISNQAAAPNVHPAGYPMTTLPYHQLAAASITVDHLSGVLAGSVTLKAEPPPGAAPEFTVYFGIWTDTECTSMSNLALGFAGEHPPSYVTRSGATYSFSLADASRQEPPPLAQYEPYDCAVALTYAPADEEVVDVLEDRTVEATRVVPSLSLGAVSPTRLVRGVWTTLDVAVRNPSLGYVSPGTLTGGPGLRVKPVSVQAPEPYSPDQPVWARVQVKLTSSSRSVTNSFTLTTPEAVASTPATFTRIKPPAKPRPGRWKGKASRSQPVSFRVTRKGVVKGFALTQFLSCGAGQAVLWPTELPSMRVAKNGRVQRTFSTDAAYEIDLYVSKRKAKGWVSAERDCAGTSTFKARWVRR